MSLLIVTDVPGILYSLNSFQVSLADPITVTESVSVGGFLIIDHIF